MDDAPQQHPPKAVGYKFGGFVLDASRGVLLWPDRTEVGLRPKSAEVLCHLARSPGQVVSRDDLMEAVWPGVIVTDDSITQCVAEIRRALGADGAELLRTLPKRGYMLTAAVTMETLRPHEAAPPADGTVVSVAAVPPPALVDVPLPPVPSRWPRPTVWLGAGLGLAVLIGAAGWRSLAPQAPPAVPAQLQPAAALPQAEAGASVATEPAASTITRRRSILVLPFAGAGGDATQSDLADAITDELIAGFGSLPNTFVIGRGTAFTFRDRTPDVRQLGRELGVRYVLDGTVRRFGAQVLVSVHLQDTATGGQLWADRFELPLVDLADLPRLTFSRIRRPMGYELDAIEGQRSLAERPNHPDVLDLMIRGFAIRPNSRETNAAARALFAEAAALDDSYADAHAALGGTYIGALNSDYSQDREADLVSAERHIWRALVLDQRNMRAHFWRGVALQFRWRFEEALAEFDLVIAAERGNARAIAARGFVLVHMDRCEEAITALRNAMRISPLDPGLHRWTWMLGQAIRRLGREEEALPYFLRATSMRPLDDQYRAGLVSLYGMLGRSADAAASLHEWQDRRPGLTVAHFRRQGAGLSPYPLWRAGFERYLEGLRLAGMPEE